MSHGEVFSANLVRLCAREPDVMTVCRGTKINRQQFQRYLSGTVPYERNLEKICKYFGVKPQDMFVSEAKPSDKPITDKTWWSHVDLRAALKLVHSETRPSLPSGLYFSNFAVPGHPNRIVRAATIVRTDGNLTTFRRLTGVAERRGSFWSLFHGDHKGIIVERAHWIYFLALNARGNREPTLVSARWLHGSRFMLGGQALVSGPTGPTATAVVIAPCPSRMTLRTAIRSSRAYTAADAELDPMMVEALAGEARSLAERTSTQGTAGIRPPQ